MVYPICQQFSNSSARSYAKHWNFAACMVSISVVRRGDTPPFVCAGDDGRGSDVMNAFYPSSTLACLAIKVPYAPPEQSAGVPGPASSSQQRDFQFLGPPPPPPPPIRHSLYGPEYMADIEEFGILKVNHRTSIKPMPCLRAVEFSHAILKYGDPPASGLQLVS